jgi:hypothetical protein
MYANVIKNNYRNELCEEQYAFQEGQSYSDSYFTLRILLQKYREFNIELIAFVEF